MKTYPYIGKGKHSGAVFLFTGKCAALTMHQGSESRYSTFETDIQEDLCTNITHEYLANTYGEVVSPEHAEFIVELAELHGFEVAEDDDEKGMTIEKYCKGGEIVHFYTWKNYMGQAFIAFTRSADVACDDGEKLITIPLPPKAEPKIYPQDNPVKAPKHFDCVCNKCGGKCCAGQCDKQEVNEWPVLGSKVITSDGVGYVRLTPDSKGYYVIEVDGEYSQLTIEEFEKPKTPEEELRDDLTRVMQRNLTYKQTIDDLLENFNIAKKPQ